MRRAYSSLSVALSIGLSALIVALATGCATPPQVMLSADKPDVTAKLIGAWKGNWYADIGSSGRFEIEITSVDGDRVGTTGKWHDTVVGTAPFSVSGGFKDGAVWLPRTDQQWFDLKFHQAPGEYPQLIGRYSTVGLGRVYLGSIRVTKQ